MAERKLDFERVNKEYKKGMDFKQQIGLFETVRSNERFFVGNQWEGVESRGLPTPQFNFLKQVTLFNVASITSDNIKMSATALSGGGQEAQGAVDVVNGEFDRLFEFNKVPTLIREFMRNAAVCGDACTYTYFDAEAETGQDAKGAVVTEIIENTRVVFGNANDKRVQKQPYIILATRELVEDVRERAKEYGRGDTGDITADHDDSGSDRGRLTDDKVTVLLRLWKDKETGTVKAYECTHSAVIRPEWDLGIRLYPLTWLCWDYIPDSYHGQALITGLIPNQIFVNKLFAMSQISFMTSAYPRIIYDKSRVSRWTNQVGAAIGINGGDVNQVAKVLEGSTLSPQISQFIDIAINYTKTFLGATPAAMGETRPDNTSAIIALQRAAAIPSELTKQSLYQSIEDLGRIYLEFMGEYYGQRLVDRPVPEEIAQFAGTQVGTILAQPFDFSLLKQMPMSLKLDVGASAYWSEVASMQTMDNLLTQNKIELVDYLERVPEGYIAKKQELIQKIKQRQAAAQAEMPAATDGPSGPAGQVTAPVAEPEIPDNPGGGYSALQRAVNETGQLP